MENKLQIFKNTAFGEIRTIENNGNPLFVCVDVANVLGYTNPRKAISDHCRYVTKSSIPHPQSKNKLIEVLVMPQGDVLRLIATSKLPSAQKFESWVFDEVIPSVIKTGRYVAPQQQQPSTLLALEQTLSIMKDFDTRINTLTEKQDKLEKIISEPHKDWLTVAKERVEYIGGHKFRQSGLLLADLYFTLEKSKNILLNSRVSRYQKTMKRKGATSKECNLITKLFIISLDKDLKLAFENILTEREMKVICPSPARMLV